MKKLLGLIAVFLIISGVVFAVEQNERIAVWKYKITVEVQTPEGIKSGSAVRQVRAVMPLLKLPESKTIQHEVTGEAVPIDLGKKGYVFALVDWNSFEDVYRALPFGNDDAKDRLKHYSTLPVGTKAELKVGHPRMVMFGDINDPKSVKLVYAQPWISREEGYKIEDHFPEIFGEGYKLKAIIIEITDEPLNWGVVDKYLPLTYDEIIRKGWKELTLQEKQRLYELTRFKHRVINGYE